MQTRVPEEEEENSCKHPDSIREALSIWGIINNLHFITTDSSNNKLRTKGKGKKIKSCAVIRKDFSK